MQTELSRLQSIVRRDKENQRIQGVENYAIPKSKIPEFSQNMQHMMEQALAKLVQGQSPYAFGIVNPFLPFDRGLRVPQVNPEPTVTFDKHDTSVLSMEANSKCYVFGNHTQATRAATFIKGTRLNPLIIGLETGKLVNDIGVEDGNSFTALKLYNSGGTAALNFKGSDIKSSISYCESIPLQSETNRLRLVCGGNRLNKVSTSDNESAIIIANNAPKGFNVVSASVDSMLEEANKHRVKTFTAGHPADTVVGLIYRPQDV